MIDLQAPFPWFGGKSRVAHIVWERFGNVPNYVEPFFGSGAVLLGRPHEPGIETVNDKDGFVANFWRAIKHDPEAVAQYSDNPVNENDLHARHGWLVHNADGLTERLEGDPDYYDAKVAGWWVWGLCCWIGGGWCSGKGPWSVVDGLLVKSGDAGRGVNRQLPHLGNAGQGVNRQTSIYEWFDTLAARFSRTRVCCGDWKRVTGPTVTTKLGVTGVFLDPPYSHSIGRDNALYRVESDISKEVFEWAMDNAPNTKMRIAVCGYAGEYAFPETWTCVPWKAPGGYGSRTSRGSENATKERIWFSPHCLDAELIFNHRSNTE